MNAFQDDFRRCGRTDEHDPHAWTKWFRWERGNVVRLTELSVTYWCDGYPTELEDK